MKRWKMTPFTWYPVERHLFLQCPPTLRKRSLRSSTIERCLQQFCCQHRCWRLNLEFQSNKLLTVTRRQKYSMFIPYRNPQDSFGKNYKVLGPGALGAPRAYALTRISICAFCASFLYSKEPCLIGRLYVRSWLNKAKLRIRANNSAPRNTNSALAKMFHLLSRISQCALQLQ